MKHVITIIGMISKWSGLIFCYLAIPGMLVLVYEVCARYLFNAPTLWGHGVSQRIFAVYYLIGAAYVLYYNGHIRMDILYNRLSLRKRAIIDLVSSPLFYVTVLVLLWQGFDFAWTSVMQLEPCNTPFRAPLYPVKVFVPLTGFLLLLQGLANTFRDFYTAITGKRYEY